ncbi:MAG: nuclear transport factor 2 family protein [Alphaproteobacteria bacterium]|nr:nuclear transport factor 2 family protein [Alphaproteobacteria bacterium]MCW5752700.1 nuclear transport factor 2 family protein [Alphaproteobacteria bacterium]
MGPDHKAVARMSQSYTAAWNAKSAEAVASHYADDGQIVINRGTPWKGRAGIRDMAAGFYADVPDLSLTCDDIRCAGSHAVYVWTFTGHHAGSGRPLKISGWEEWELDDDLRVKSSLGWYDAEDYARQVEGR